MSKAIGIDPGTAFFQVAEKKEDGTVNIQIVRNAFVEMAGGEDTEDTLKRNSWNYVKDGNKFYVIGEDAMKVAKAFPNKVELRRPLADGVLNKGEDKKIIVLDSIIDSTIGQAPDETSVACFCVSSPSIDGSQDSSFHKMRLGSMFKSRGWNVKVIEEALAVILSERPVITEIVDGVEKSAPYSGLGCSFGGGRSNAVLAYKGVQVVGMSIAQGGDKIDKQVSDATGLPLAQVTSYKEKNFDFDNVEDSDIGIALDVYYGELIRSVFSSFGKKFQEVKSEFDAPLDIVIAGGTSMPPGFVNKVKKIVKNLNLPFKIKDVIHAKDPRNAVVEGCLAQAIVSQKRLVSGVEI
jgi:hypothetical protein